MTSQTKTSREEQLKTPLEIEDAIRRRAYEFYEQRGYINGYDVEDWLLAEQETKPEQQKKAA